MEVEMELEKEHFSALYSCAFPAKKGAVIRAWTKMSGGWESDLFLVNLDFEEEGEQRSEEAVLKLYHGESGIQKARKESHALQQLTQMGYPVPHLLFSSIEDLGENLEENLGESSFGRAMVAIEKIEGQVLARVLDGSSLEEQRALMRQFCELYVRLHALDWKELMPDLEYAHIEDVFGSWLTQALAMVDQLLPGMFDPVIAWVQERRSEVSFERLSIIHGDFHAENLLLRDDGKLYVIDWTNVDVSDFRYDLAWSLLLLRTQGQEKLASVMLEEYERLLGHSIEDLEFFEVIACCRRLFDIAASLRYGASTLGMRPEATTEMRGMAGHVRAVYALLQERTGCRLPEIEGLIGASYGE